MCEVGAKPEIFVLGGGSCSTNIFIKTTPTHSHTYTHTHTFLLYIHIYKHAFLFDKLYICTHPIKKKSIFNQNYV